MPWSESLGIYLLRECIKGMYKRVELDIFHHLPYTDNTTSAFGILQVNYDVIITITGATPTIGGVI